ncbi:hypothetical protein V9K67_24465 [Paraflavisolibacter sp. H34]|uniref:hypothetical protein n=1 Tax=Huijunlia imazamoxiresistens TaxID=3127457 RepID=UPI00301B47E5
MKIKRSKSWVQVILLLFLGFFCISYKASPCDLNSFASYESTLNSSAYASNSNEVPIGIGEIQTSSINISKELLREVFGNRKGISVVNRKYKYFKCPFFTSKYPSFLAPNTPNVYKGNESSKSLEGGCIEIYTRCTAPNTVPPSIYASPASFGGCSGNYAYQWQKSTDNQYFTDIPGASSQNLSYNQPLNQGTFFQRRATCGNAVKYTNSVYVSLGSCPSSSIYARIELDNPRLEYDSWPGSGGYDAFEEYARVLLRFYANEACTIPLTLTSPLYFTLDNHYVNHDVAKNIYSQGDIGMYSNQLVSAGVSSYTISEEFWYFYGYISYSEEYPNNNVYESFESNTFVLTGTSASSAFIVKPVKLHYSSHPYYYYYNP